MKDNLGNEIASSEVEMVEWSCATCGCVQWMPKGLNDSLRSNHNSFYCVTGHANVYTKKTNIEEIQGKLMNEYAKNAQLETEINKLKKSLVNRIFKP